MPALSQLIIHKNLFGRQGLVDADKVDKSKPFTYTPSIDGCDEETLAELMYYGREMLITGYC